jgi:hypothetical protein
MRLPCLPDYTAALLVLPMDIVRLVVSVEELSESSSEDEEVVHLA